MREVIDLYSFHLHGCEGLEEEKGSIKRCVFFASSAHRLKFSREYKVLWKKTTSFFPQVFIHPSIRVCQIFWAVYVVLLKPISVAISSIYLISAFLWISFCWKCNQGSCLKANKIRPPMPCGKWLWTAKKKYECLAIRDFQDKGHLLISPVPDTVLRQWQICSSFCILTFWSVTEIFFPFTISYAS